MNYRIGSHCLWGVVCIVTLIVSAAGLIWLRFPTTAAAQGFCPGCNDQAFIDQCYAYGGYIDDVAARRGECFCIGGDSPIILDTRGEGIKLTSAVDGVMFDIRGTGTSLRYSWTQAESANAFLVLDRNQNGRIDNGSELFGNYTAQPTSNAPNGFLALAEYDKAANGGNGDGVIDGTLKHYAKGQQVRPYHGRASPEPLTHLQ